MAPTAIDIDHESRISRLEAGMLSVQQLLSSHSVEISELRRELTKARIQVAVLSSVFGGAGAAVGAYFGG